MKNIKFYMGFLVLALLLVGCSKSQPIVEKKSEDRYTKIFLNCFSTGKVSLNRDCKNKLQTFLLETPIKYKREIIIEVHTDLGGTAQQNQLISDKRAFRSAASLNHKDYKESEIYYSGFGEERPLLNSSSKKANILNRRLVVKLKEKNHVVDKKVFKKYSDKRKTPLSNLEEHTGDADTDWMYFGDSSLEKKFLISCKDDEPRKVRRTPISDSNKSEFLSGFYKKRITGDVNENYVVIYPVYLYKNGDFPKTDPIVTIYAKDKEVQELQTTVNSYRGKKGILYRIFVNDKKNIKCMDLVIPYGTKEVSYGRVYGEENGKLIESDFVAE